MEMSLTSDPQLAKAFIEALTGDPNAVVTFQTFDDEKSDDQPPRAELARVFHGTLDNYAGQLADLSRQGAGVFVMVNEGDGVVHGGKHTCRTNSNVVRLRAVFVDLDGSPLEPVLQAKAPPDLIVESSPGRWHAYWFVDDSDLSVFGPTQSALAQVFSGDPAVKDLARVMRLPGFHHQKGEPFMTHIVYSPVGASKPAPTSD